MQFNNNFLTIKVNGDYFGHGFILNYPEVKLGNRDMSDGKYRLAITFDLPGASTSFNNTVDFNLFNQGNSLNNVKGGSIYKLDNTFYTNLKNLQN